MNYRDFTDIEQNLCKLIEKFYELINNILQTFHRLQGGKNSKNLQNLYGVEKMSVSVQFYGH